MTTERATPADMLIVNSLCQGLDSATVVGPYAWTCRRAWHALISGREFDFDAHCATHTDWLNKPEHAKDRKNLAACVEFIRTVAAKAPLWELTDNAFDASEWLAPKDGGQ